MTTALLYVFLTFSYFILRICSANDSITTGKPVRDGETLISGDGTFKLAFFSPANSTDRYVGIWYKKVPIMKVVWVANRNNPLNDSSGIFKISEDGNLQVMNGQNETLWQTNVTHRTSNFSTAQLLDSGSLVLLSSNSTVLWQSIDHPTNTFLPKMSVTFNKETCKTPLLHSWRSPANPSSGRFSLRICSVDLPEFIFFDGDRPYWRSGPWNGFMFIGIQVDYPDLHSHAMSFQNDGQGNVTMVYSSSEVYLSNYELSYRGTAIHQYWDGANGNWKILWQYPENECGFYGKCGEFGICNSLQHPICRCLEGYFPKNREEWDKGNWSSGCTRRTQLQCGNEGAKDDGFIRLKKMKVPAQTEWSSGLDEDRCRSHCLGNCSCLAYAYDVGVGCMYWSTNLIDTVEFSNSGVDLYIRLASSELGTHSKLKAIIAVAVVSGTTTLLGVTYFLWNRKVKQGKKSEDFQELKNMLGKSKAQVKLEELTFFDFKDLALATNDFQESNKLGEGGFGQVFRGKLADGLKIAVKRLSLTSRQGLEEFLNEAAVVSKLQHRNLVKLFGCCIEQEEKMLIYEYMPNKSLDIFLFDPLQELLDWKKRFIIIRGICRGLQYLHRDSRLRIIHRDLKVSNILLDEAFNPKIADFGMARIFGGNQDQAETKRLVGTYGYMAPEYAMEGRFSEKSDVFSFGVLLLEIVSGKRNSRFSDEEQSLSLLGYAWKLWKQGDIVFLADSVIYEPCFHDEIVRCIQVALLCVQEFPKDRPDIITVISMIQSEIANLPNPKQPGFTQSQFQTDQDSSQQEQESCSSNNVSITVISAR